MRKSVFMAIVLLALTGCTQQQRARNFGGTATIDLPTNRKLITATWKETDLWYLTRPMHPDENAEAYEFVESSSLGVMEGKVIFREHK